MIGARRRVLGRLDDAVGGPARLRVILLLSGALALAAADQTIAGAVAPDIKSALGVGNTQIGLLVTATSLMAAATTLPFGVLADRVTRVRLLAGCAIAWSASIVLAGTAQSYLMLLLAQIALGAGVGAAGPVVASLAGDLFPTGSRGRALGFILAGEFAGAASGLLIAGEIAALWSWRGSFWVLAAAGPILAVALVRLLPEPHRGGGSLLAAGATRVVAADDARAAGSTPALYRSAPPRANAANRPTSHAGTADDATIADTSATTDAFAVTEGTVPNRSRADAELDRQPLPDPALKGIPLPSAVPPDLVTAIRDAGVQPHTNLVLTADPTGRSLAWSIRYVLSIRTNVVIIVASALGYFYVAGMQTFAVVYLRGRFDLGQGLATVLLAGIGAGVIVGTLITGRASDRLIARRHLAARPLVGAACFLLAVAFFIPGFALTSAFIAVPLLFLGAAAVGGVNPPLDAARLDIMHSRLWGRAEAVRTFWQTLLKSSAPLVFGYLSTLMAGSGNAEYPEQGGGADGLDRAFLVLLVILLLAGLVLLVAGRTYPRDVATAIASEEATRSQGI